MSETRTEKPVRRDGPGAHGGPGSRPVALPSLTGVRFLAAAAVFFCHTSLPVNVIPPFLPVVPFANQELAARYNEYAFNLGYVGVSFFFILSGFVLTWSTPPGSSTTAFWRRRLFKIFPNHLVTFAVAMVLFAAAITPWTQWLPNLFLVQSWSTDAPTRFAVNSLSWSLCAELLFYLLFPLIIRPLRRIPESRIWLWIGGFFAAMFAIALVNYLVVREWLPDPNPLTASQEATGPQYWFGYFLPPARLFEFLIGVLVARLVLAGRWPRITVRQALALTVAAYVLTIFVPVHFVFNVTTVLPMALLIGSLAVADVAGKRGLMAGRTWQWLGEVSFAFYMTQGIVLLWVRHAMGGTQYSVPVGIGLIVLLFGANLVAAWALYSLVERPVMRRWSRASRSTANSANPAVPAESVGEPPGEEAVDADTVEQSAAGRRPAGG